MTCWKFLFSLICMALLSNSAGAENCLPAVVEKDAPPELEGGAYHRMDPTGQWMIAYIPDSIAAGTGFGNTMLVDFRGKAGKSRSISLGAETYPVEGDWRLIGSPSVGGVSYHEFRALQGGSSSGKAFTGELGGLYHVSGTLPGGDADHMTLRTVSYGTLAFADYDVQFSKGKYVSSKRKMYSQKELCWNLAHNGQAQKVMQLMLSKDGTEIAGMTPKQTGKLQLFRVKPDLTCTQEELPIPETQKVMFSHPQPGKLGYIAFSGGAELSDTSIASGKVAIYDRDLKKMIRASRPIDGIVSYTPGTLKDGRVSYLAKVNGKLKYVIVDPYQIDPQPGVGCLKAAAPAGAGGVGGSGGGSGSTGAQ